ncbi:MAG: TadE/TadG family type IV pilus assembly protein [Alphaproteobacteria bacterium]|nr:TadE/TadG family type IV pilus assembly protein [Alphaproteobacteria bacterium]
MLKQFLRAREGNVMLIFALSALTVIGATGVAIDIGRSQMVQAKLQNAVDAAGLAAGATLSTTDLAAVATKYINLNFAQNNLGATLGIVTTTLSADKKILTVSAGASLPTTLTKLFNRSEVSVSAYTEVTRANKGIELVLVLDNTGSMNSAVNPANSPTTKITALKDAVAGTNGLLDILYGAGNNTADNLWVGVVPFSQVVNIGTTTSWVAANSYDWGVPIQPWEGCVMARSAPYDMSDDPPSVDIFTAYYAPTTGTVTSPVSGTGVSGSCSGGLNAWKCTVLSSGLNILRYNYSYSGSLGTNRGPNAECPQQVTPMVAEKATVAAAVNAMVAKGSTFINAGMAWGYRMLSPRWRNLWGGQMDTNNLPLDYNTPLMTKVVVLMTDGMNSFSNGNFTTYGFLSDNQLGTTKSMTSGYSYAVSAEKVLDDRTLAVCNEMKSHGVVIYTIGFGADDTNNFSSSKSVNGPLLKACATSEAYYFLAPTNADLQNVFHAIGDSLANLRISQ